MLALLYISKQSAEPKWRRILMQALLSYLFLLYNHPVIEEFSHQFLHHHIILCLLMESISTRMVQRIRARSYSRILCRRILRLLSLRRNLFQARQLLHLLHLQWAFHLDQPGLVLLTKASILIVLWALEKLGQSQELHTFNEFNLQWNFPCQEASAFYLLLSLVRHLHMG